MLALAPVASNSLMTEHCCLPWVALQRATTAVKTCCAQDANFESDPSVPLQAVFNGPAAKEVRKSFLEGRVPEVCRQCVNASKTTTTQKTEMSPKWQSSTTRSFAPRLCRTVRCGLPFAISILGSATYAISPAEPAIAQAARGGNRWIALGRHPYELERWDQDPRAMENIIGLLPELEEIYFAGGEPLINPGHYRILDWLVTNDRVNLTLTYNTNLSTTRYQSFDVMNYWSKFKTVHVIPSVDSTGERGEYIRTGKIWNRFAENLGRVRQYVQSVHAVVSVYNVLSVLDLIRWAKLEHGLVTNLFCCYHPDFLSITVLSSDAKKQITRQYLAFIEGFREYLDEGEISRLMQVIHYMNSADRSDLAPQFKKYTENLDGWHGTSFRATFPELEGWYSLV